jgi:hypothetical protein
MANGIPEDCDNVPLEYCRKISKELRAMRIDPARPYEGRALQALVEAIAERTEKLELFIQQDQSGEI